MNATATPSANGKNDLPRNAMTLPMLEQPPRPDDEEGDEPDEWTDLGGEAFLPPTFCSVCWGEMDVSGCHDLMVPGVVAMHEQCAAAAHEAAIARLRVRSRPLEQLLERA